MLYPPHGVNLHFCKGAHLRILDFIVTESQKPHHHPAKQSFLQPFDFAIDFSITVGPQRKDISSLSIANIQA